MTKKQPENSIKRIISEKHLNETNADFNKFLKGKKPATVKRYKSYRNNVNTKRAEGYNIRVVKGYIVFKKRPRAGSGIPDFRDIPEIDKPHTYSHAFEFVCKTPSLKERRHRHNQESRVKRPSLNKAFNTHAKQYPEHIVLEQNYEGTWVIF